MTEEQYINASKIDLIEVAKKKDDYYIYVTNDDYNLLFTGTLDEKGLKDLYGEEISRLIIKAGDTNKEYIYDGDIRPILSKYSDYDNAKKENKYKLIKKAKEKFGTTRDYRLAFYLNVDGTMLKADGDYYTRATDHREIGHIMTDYDGSEAMYRYMELGNIRLQPETPGFEIMVEPTEQQYKVLQQYGEYFVYKDNDFYIDIVSANGNSRAEKEYSIKTIRNLTRDIRQYFSTGELPSENNLTQFL